MNGTGNGGKRWFSAADALIVLIVIALAVGAALLFLFPGEEKTTAVTVETAMHIHLTDTLGLSEGDKLFSGDTEIGTISSIRDEYNIQIKVTLEKDNGVYFLNGVPVREKGSFVLETRKYRIEGVIDSISERSAEK